MRKRKFLFIIILSIIFLYSLGLVLSEQNTPSEVSVDFGIKVIYTEFYSYSDTTNLISMSDSELESVSDLTLENIYGKIIFNGVSNLTKDSIDNIINLDDNVEIITNRIEVNTSSMTSLDKGATLYLYNIFLSNPRILKNGVVCPTEICSRISYSSGMFIFSVSNLSNSIYSLEETPTTPSVPSDAVTGGGGGKVFGLFSIKNPFSIDKDLIIVKIKQGELRRENIVITNNKSEPIEIKITNELGNILLINKESFILNGASSETINLDFFAREEELPDVYAGRLLIEGDGVTRVVSIISNVLPKQPLFDMKLTVLNKTINQGDNVFANIDMLNMGDEKDLDLNLYYSIRGFENQTFVFKEESLAINQDLNLTRELKLPENIYGTFIYYSKITYGNLTATSSDVFIVQRKTTFVPILYLFFIFLLILLWVVILISYRSIKSKHKQKN